MKRVFTIAALMLTALTAIAQPQGRGPRGNGRPDGRGPMMVEMSSPEQMARQEADRLTRLLLLSESQYNRIYRFNVRQMRSLENRMVAGRPDMRQMRRLEEKRDRKYHRVLNAAQYEKWVSFQTQKEFRRMRDRH